MEVIFETKIEDIHVRVVQDGEDEEMINVQFRERGSLVWYDYFADDRAVSPNLLACLLMDLIRRVREAI